MSWLELHRKRTSNEGGDIKGERERQSVHFLNQNFKDSPSYVHMEVGGEMHHTRLILDKRYNLATDVETKMLLLLPYDKVDRGDIAIIGDENWLVVFFNRMELKPRAHIRFCNEMLRFGNGSSYPCIVDNKLQGFQTVDEFNPINLPADSLQITAAYNEDTQYIRELDRFVFKKGAFEVQAFDRVKNVYDDKGIINIIVKKVPLTEDELEANKEVEEVVTEDYHIEIEGSKDVEINSISSYTGNVYLNGELTSENVSWTIEGSGDISFDGVLTTGSVEDTIRLVATFVYRDDNGTGQSIEATKKIKIIDNNNWGWG